MFLGRDKELVSIKEQLLSNKKTAILVYGKRRVGKSTLIAEASKNFDGIVISHLCSETTYEGNLALLCRSISQMLNIPQISFSTIFDIFDFLKSQNKKILLILDEYQYLKNSLKAKEMDSFMQSIIDNLSPNVKLILCGSYISIMKELLQQDNPLFGRFTLIQHIQELNYLEASLFYPNLSVNDKLAFYSIFGGSPYVLTNLDYNLSVEENICNYLIDQNSILNSHITNVMLKEIQKSYDVRILEVLANGKKRYSEIQNILDKEKNGYLDKQLKILLDMDTITKTYPINKKDDRQKVFYEIKDNLMRFFFTYIFKNSALIAKLGEQTFFENYIKNSITTFISLRFEKIVNQYFELCAKKGKLSNVLDLGSFWYDDIVNKTNGQFDCVIQTKQGYDFYECKYYKKPMTLAECKQEESQINNIKNLPCNKIGFVCSSGFDFTNSNYNLITGNMLYQV